jgi:hypothetical protein
MIDSAALLAIPAAPPAAVVTPGRLVTSAAAAGRSGLGRRQRRAIGVVIGPQAKFEDICPARRLDIEALSRPVDPHAQIARRCARLVPAGAVLALPPPASAVDAAGQGRGRVIVRWGAVGAEPAADCFGKLFVLGGSAYRTEIGRGETGAGHGLLLRDRLGGIWEAASGANRSEPVPTELKQTI